MMLIWLLVCLSGVIDLLGFGSIANGAHVGGLLVRLPQRFAGRPAGAASPLSEGLRQLRCAPPAPAR